MVVLISSDNKQFSINIEDAKLSKLLESKMKSDEDNITMEDLNGATLGKIVEFMKYYRTNPLNEVEKPIKTSNLYELVGDRWYGDYICGIRKKQLSSFSIIAEFMGIRPLIELVCIRLATIYRNKTPRQIKRSLLK